MAQDGQDCFHCIYVCQQSKDGRVANESIFLKEVWEEWRHDNRHCIGDGSIQKNSCLLNKLLTRIAVTRAGSARAKTKWRRTSTRNHCIKLLCRGSTSCLIQLEIYWRNIWTMHLQVHITFSIVFFLLNTATVAENLLPINLKGFVQLIEYLESHGI